MRNRNRLPVSGSVFRSMRAYDRQLFEGTAVPIHSQYEGIAFPLEESIDPRVTQWFRESLDLKGSESEVSRIAALWKYTKATVKGRVGALDRNGERIDIDPVQFGDFLQPRYDFQNTMRKEHQARLGAFRVLLEGHGFPFVTTVDSFLISAGEHNLVFEPSVYRQSFVEVSRDRMRPSIAAEGVEDAYILETKEAKRLAANRVKSIGLGKNLMPIEGYLMHRFYRPTGCDAIKDLARQFLSGY